MSADINKRVAAPTSVKITRATTVRTELCAVFTAAQVRVALNAMYDLDIPPNTDMVDPRSDFLTSIEFAWTTEVTESVE